MISYHTIRKSTQGIYKEKGSKFLAFSFPVAEVDQVKVHLESIRNKYHDARHHCFGYVVGMEEQYIRANDDGEPNHSAGDPILGQIKSFGLTNVLVIVVRYFGGIKLGVGGLVRAYKEASHGALSKAEIIKIYPTNTIRLQFPYEMTPVIESILDQFDIEYTDKVFTEDCLYEGKVRSSETAMLSEKLGRLKDIHFETLK